MRYFIIALVCLVLFVPVAQADPVNHTTYFTFNTPFSLPGVTLPAGTYLFERDASSPSVARIFSSDRRHLYATLMTLPTMRVAPADEPTVVFTERPTSLPPAMRAWFYPGETYGQEFLWSNTGTKLAGAPAPASADSDKALAAQVAEKIREYSFYTIFDDVEGTVDNGVVRLTGKVTMPYKASEIAERVGRVPGVREVDNKIETLPVSIFDDELRARIARQIYRDPLFWNYGLQTNPPIHVIVEHGRVTLKGAVNSEVERRMAEVIARSSSAFSVENKLQVDKNLES